MAQTAKKLPTPSPTDNEAEHRGIDGGAPGGPKRALLVRFLCELYRDWEQQQDQEQWNSRDDG